MIKVIIMLICKRCGAEGDEKLFSAHSGCKSGFDTSACKKCKKAAFDWSQVSLEKRMFNRTKARATRLGKEFNLSLEDIVLPDVCPVFNKPFIYGDQDWTYSIDRINNNLGYVRGNIMIISNKANRIKGDSSLEDLEKLTAFYRACEVTF
jgi:hypothetical protein